MYFGGHRAKFGLNRSSVFDNMKVVIFRALYLSLRMPIPAHFGGVLEVKIGEVGNVF